MAKSELVFRTYSGHSGPVTCLSISLDSHLLASGGEDGKVLLWRLDNDGGHRHDDDSHSSEPVRSLEHRGGPMSAVFFALPPREMLLEDERGPGLKSRVFMAQALQKVEVAREVHQLPSSFLTPEGVLDASLPLAEAEDAQEENTDNVSAFGGGRKERDIADADSKKSMPDDEREKLVKINFNLYQMLKGKVLESEH